MCILSVCQYTEVHYGEVHFVECITAKPTVAMCKIAIDSVIVGSRVGPVFHWTSICPGGPTRQIVWV
jgi:hypothetical protein